MHHRVTGRRYAIAEAETLGDSDSASERDADHADRVPGLRASGRERHLLGRASHALAIALATLALPQAGFAQWSMPDERPASQVVLELYTAQGCSACPPADAMMAELAMREDVIALSLHVDYWDYIGWTDTFASNTNTMRQTHYARRQGQSTIYTPQVVINGSEIIEGFRVKRVMESIASHSARPPGVALDITRGERDDAEKDGYRLEIHARHLAAEEEPLELTSRAAASAPALLGSLSPEASPAGEPLHLQLVRYKPSAHVTIETGENAGRKVQYFNIVTDWTMIGEWDMRAPLEMAVTVNGSEPAVVILQEADQGEIVAAARMR